MTISNTDNTVQTLSRGGCPNQISQGIPVAKKTSTGRQETSKLRIATVNVGTLRGRINEVAETLERRKIAVCCLQETRYKAQGTRLVVGKECKYKLFWSGDPSGMGGVGIMVAEDWISKIIAVNRVNSRLMSVKLLVGKTIMVFHSAYAPQSGLAIECKEEFYSILNRCLNAQDENVLTFIGGDMNGHVGSDRGGYTAHGGFGYGTRNLEGNLILEFCTAQDMFLSNTFFKRREEQLLTYSSGGG